MEDTTQIGGDSNFDTPEGKVTLTIEDIPTLSIKLAEGKAYWRLESGAVELNSFTGKVSARLDGSLSEYDRMAVMFGLNSGNIIIANEVKDEEPSTMDISNLLSSVHINARILLDEKHKDKFVKTLSTIRNEKLLTTCAEVEIAEGKRKAFIKAIDSRLKELE